MPMAEGKAWYLGLTGWPLGHSLSPRLHNAALAAAGLSGEYALYPVPAGDVAGLAALLARLRTGELSGLNVTIPHKQTVIPLLDALTPAAQAIGAVNTVINTQWSMDNGQWLSGGAQLPMLVGDNTDAPGFLRDARRFLGDAFGQRPFALLLGAGGSARAVAYALAQEGWAVTVAARQLAQAQALVTALADKVAGTLTAVALTADALAGLEPGLLVNCTPLGMTPHTEVTPWPETVPLPQTAVYDLVYNPPETRLVREARAVGLPATTGYGMLLEQAALAFARWTGIEPDFGPDLLSG